MQPSVVLNLTLYTNCNKTLKLTLIVNFLRTKQLTLLVNKVGFCFMSINHLLESPNMK